MLALTFSHCSEVNAALVSSHVSWCVFLNSPNVRCTVSRTGADGDDAQRESASSAAGIQPGTSYGAESTHDAKRRTEECASSIAPLFVLFVLFVS
jgi:hypothetical protein